MRIRIQTLEIAGKDKSPNLHGWHQTICTKWKRNGNSNKRRQNIQSRHRNRIWHRKMCNARNETWQTTSNWQNGTINKDKIRKLGEKEDYKHLTILAADTIKQVEMKRKSKKNISGKLESYLRQTIKQKPYQRNKYLGCNPRYIFRTIFEVDQRRTDQSKDQRTRKLMTMRKVLHPRDEVDRLYVSRKRGIKRTCLVDVSIQRLKDYIEKHEGGLITAIRNDSDNMMDNRMIITRKQKEEEKKQLYGCFKRLINNVSHDKTKTWPRKGNFMRET